MSRPLIGVSRETRRGARERARGREGGFSKGQLVRPRPPAQPRDYGGELVLLSRTQHLCGSYGSWVTAERLSLEARAGAGGPGLTLSLSASICEMGSYSLPGGVRGWPENTWHGTWYGTSMRFAAAAVISISITVGLAHTPRREEGPDPETEPAGCHPGLVTSSRTPSPIPSAPRAAGSP